MSTLIEPQTLPVAEAVTSSTRQRPLDDDASWNEYRPLSMLAVVSAVVSLVSFVAYVDVLLVSIAVLGAVLAGWAYGNAKTHRDEIRGFGLAKFALGLAVFNIIGGVSAFAYEYSTELPAGHIRLSYQTLEPDERDPEKWQAKLKELDGQSIFIKGYALAGNQQQGIKTFILCRDKGDCCFGGNPKITERVLIKLSEPAGGIEYTDRLQKFSGVFHYKPTKNAVQVSNGGDVWYIVEGAVKR